MKSLDTLVEDIYHKLEPLCEGKPLDLTDKEIDEFGEALKTVIKQWAHPEERNANFSLRMSNIGKPARQLWFDKREKIDSKPTPPTMIKFLYGHILEELVLVLARLSGHVVTDEQKSVQVEGITGHMDCKIDGEVVDVKTASSFAFRKFKYGSLPEDDSFGYLPQLAGYEAAEGTNKGGFLAINKESGEEEENIVRVELKEDFELKWESDRNFYTTSSCGVCGKASIESVETSASCSILENGVPQVEMDILRSLPKKLRSDQNVFEHTGGLHAVAAFNTNGELLMMREDVGRHNALDKLIGAAQIAEMDLSQCILLLSGRASFELIQKSVMAQIPVVAAIGAPSSLAVNLAQNFHMTLIGFLKKDRFNIYSDFGRIRKNAS